jgi:protein-disulfide isomerase
MIREAPARQIAARKKRVRMLVGAVIAALAVVAGSVAISSGAGTAANAASGGKLVGTSLSRRLFAGIPQRGTSLGRPDAPVRILEFADLQCPYCDDYTLQALPTLVKDYVRTGKVQMQFENLSFIGPGSVAAGRVASAAARQNKLWNFVDLLYLNQGKENSGYVTPAYLRTLLEAVPGLDVNAAIDASLTANATAALTGATRLATEDGIDGTPSFLIGRTGGPLHEFQPASLTAAPFVAAINGLLRSPR